jgi:hypothetical protein
LIPTEPKIPFLVSCMPHMEPPLIETSA